MPGMAEETFRMCDYSLQHLTSRPAKVGEKLRTHLFNFGTRGFVSPEDLHTAVCVLPGTELAFATPVRCYGRGQSLRRKPEVLKHTTAIFRQINKDNPQTHHDALEFPNGEMVLLNDLFDGQEARMLQLPAQVVRSAELKGSTTSLHIG